MLIEWLLREIKAFQFSVRTELELEKSDKLSKSIHSCIITENCLDQVLTTFFKCQKYTELLILILLHAWIKIQYALTHNPVKMKTNCTLVWCLNCSAWSNTAILTASVRFSYPIHFTTTPISQQNTVMVCMCICCAGRCRGSSYSQPKADYSFQAISTTKTPPFKKVSVFHLNR